MNQVVRQGVKTKVLMLSATPVNNRFNDLRNQLALAYEGESENLSKKMRTGRTVEEIFRNAQTVFNQWSRLPPEDRTARAILDSLDFDFFELLDSVTIARSRKHIQTFYDTSDIGQFPERRKPLSFHSILQVAQRAFLIGRMVWKRLMLRTMMLLVITEDWVMTKLAARLRLILPTWISPLGNMT